jgi:hypothetical protein
MTCPLFGPGGQTFKAPIGAAGSLFQAQRPEPELREVVIEGERQGDVKALHDREARRIDQGEVLVVVGLQYLQSPLLFVLADTNNAYMTSEKVQNRNECTLPSDPRQE